MRLAQSVVVDESQFDFTIGEQHHDDNDERAHASAVDATADGDAAAGDADVDDDAARRQRLLTSSPRTAFVLRRLFLADVEKASSIVVVVVALHG